MLIFDDKETNDSICICIYTSKPKCELIMVPQLLRMHIMSIYWQTTTATTKTTATTRQNTTTNISTTTNVGQPAIPFFQTILKVVHDPFGKKFTCIFQGSSYKWVHHGSPLEVAPDTYF